MGKSYSTTRSIVQCTNGLLKYSLHLVDRTKELVNIFRLCLPQCTIVIWLNSVIWIEILSLVQSCLDCEEGTRSPLILK